MVVENWAFDIISANKWRVSDTNILFYPILWHEWAGSCHFSPDLKIAVKMLRASRAYSDEIGLLSDLAEFTADPGRNVFNINFFSLVLSDVVMLETSFLKWWILLRIPATNLIFLWHSFISSVTQTLVLLVKVVTLKRWRKTNKNVNAPLSKEIGTYENYTSLKDPLIRCWRRKAYVGLMSQDGISRNSFWQSYVFVFS